jgi:hypothetical protein
MYLLNPTYRDPIALHTLTLHATLVLCVPESLLVEVAFFLLAYFPLFFLLKLEFLSFLSAVFVAGRTQGLLVLILYGIRRCTHFPYVKALKVVVIGTRVTFESFICYQIEAPDCSLSFH